MINSELVTKMIEINGLESRIGTKWAALATFVMERNISRQDVEHSLKEMETHRHTPVPIRSFLFKLTEGTNKT